MCLREKLEFRGDVFILVWYSATLSTSSSMLRSFIDIIKRISQFFPKVPTANTIAGNPYLSSLRCLDACALSMKLGRGSHDYGLRQ